MSSLGQNLRILRKTKHLTLAQLGEKAGLSASYLSQLERGVTMPSLPRLAAIAEALDVEVRYFFEKNADSPRIIRANQGRRIKGGPGISVELLSTDPFGKAIQPYRMICTPGASQEYRSAYPGEWCGLVVEGELTVTVGEETFVLAAGDSIHHHRHQPHSWRNDGSEACVVIWTVSPPLSEASLKGELVEGKEVMA